DKSQAVGWVRVFERPVLLVGAGNHPERTFLMGHVVDRDRRGERLLRIALLAVVAPIVMKEEPIIPLGNLDSLKKLRATGPLLVVELLFHEDRLGAHDLAHRPEEALVLAYPLEGC